MDGCAAGNTRRRHVIVLAVRVKTCRADTSALFTGIIFFFLLGLSLCCPLIECQVVATDTVTRATKAIFLRRGKKLMKRPSVHFLDCVEMAKALKDAIQSQAKWGEILCGSQFIDHDGRNAGSRYFRGLPSSTFDCIGQRTRGCSKLRLSMSNTRWSAQKIDFASMTNVRQAERGAAPLTSSSYAEEPDKFIFSRIFFYYYYHFI
jgi:hypothetical protein